MTHSVEDIHVVTWPEAIRRRPAMYVGDVSSHLGLIFLTRGLLDVPLDPTSILISLTGTTLRIDGASVPPSTLPEAPGEPPFLIRICTSFGRKLGPQPTVAGVDALDTTVEPAVFRRLDLAPACLAIANALSSEFMMASRSAGCETRVGFARGVEVLPLESVPTLLPDGLGIAFTPDPEIFRDPRFHFELLAGAAREIALLRNARVELRDLGTGVFFLSEPASVVVG